MKKLNRKGFTLIELLAVIVILAVVMVVTIPSVLNSMANAKRSQAVNALTTIEKYVNDQIEKCKIADTTVTGQVDSSIFEPVTADVPACTPLGTNTDPETAQTAMITAAGYTLTDIVSVTGELDSTTGKYKIKAATIGASSKFKGFATTGEDGVTFTQAS